MKDGEGRGRTIKKKVENDHKRKSKQVPEVTGPPAPWWFPQSSGGGEGRLCSDPHVLPLEYHPPRL